MSDKPDSSQPLTPHGVEHEPEVRAVAAYESAATLIGRARRRLADGTDVDLSPIRPAIQDLCRTIKELPSKQAAVWVTHLLDLQHDLAALGHDLAVCRQQRLENSGGKVSEADDTGPSIQQESSACR
ncbi:MAG: hypothetical protein HWD60_06600 [Defluviicoccus sp.]|nr:MAG: hypothetical protein HWD60_06600 [Defluviicoccus sp.]